MQSRFKGLMTSDEKPIETASDEKTTTQRIIDLSLKYNILSPHTAFIGIEKRTNASNADMVLREVPIEISDDDQHLLISHQSLLLCAAPTSASGFGGSICTKRRVVNRSRLMKSHYMLVDGLDSDSDTSDADILTETNLILNATLPQLNFPSTLSDECKEERQSISVNISQKDNILPSDDQDIVRYLINKQMFDGRWNLDSDIIEKLTGKDILELRLQNMDIDGQLLNSVIVILILETRFSAFSSLWYGVVKKARNRIIELFGKDSNRIDQLFNDVRNQL